MSKPLKQIVTFPFGSCNATAEANAWLSARNHEKYETEIHISAGESYANISIVYWEPEL
jgi:hypothetical protein